jgi:uncharacterized protein (DUF362 family)
MLFSAILYFVGGSVFIISEKFFLGTLNFVSRLITPNLPEIPICEGKFWLFLAHAMMMTIAMSSYIAQLDIRKNKHFMVPVLVSKITATVAAIWYCIFSTMYLAYLFMIIVDGSLFVITLYFYLRINKEFFLTHTQYFRKRPDYLEPTGPTTVVALKDDDKFELLDNVLQETGFFEILEKRFKESGKSRKNFSVVIKPNFMFMHSKKDPSTYTDPELVEAFIDRIYEKGFTNIAIVESQCTYGNYYANKEVLKVAEYIGFSTNKNYRIIDLTEEMVAYDYGGRLGQHFVGPTWRDADFRISFAKNKTHVFCNYTLTLKNIYGTLPVQNKLKEYHTKREYDWPTIETMKHFPVHFGLIDAIYSADGHFGVVVDPKPNHTKTIIGGENLIAVDWVGAKKMGLNPDNPKVGRFLLLALEAFGEPDINWIGDRSIYKPWKNVSKLFVYALDLIEEVYNLSYWGFACLSAQDKYFAFKKKNLLVRIIRKILTPLRRRLYKHDYME